jgi:hypothetical protein
VERTKVPSAFVFVSIIFELPFSSSCTVAPAIGLPAVSRITPSIVTVSGDLGVELCSNAATLEKLISVAATTPRTVAFRFRAPSGDRRIRCHRFLTETESLSLGAASQLFSILAAILSPALVTRNESALTSALRQAATSCTLPTLRSEFE